MLRIFVIIKVFNVKINRAVAVAIIVVVAIVVVVARRLDT